MLLAINKSYDDSFDYNFLPAATFYVYNYKSIREFTKYQLFLFLSCIANIRHQYLPIIISNELPPYCYVQF